MSAPVFLLASERSGMNSLRRRLSERQDQIFGPPPIHLLKHLYFAEPYYGSLQDEFCFKTFVDEALRLIYQHFAPWDVEIHPEEVLELYFEMAGDIRSSVGVMHVLFTIFARRKGYETYFCKDNNLFDFVTDVRLTIPGARFVYLHRDPRDVILSQRQRPQQNRGIVYLAELWKDEQIKCIRHANALAKEGQVIRIAYEDFTQQEAQIMTSLCNSLGVDESLIERQIFGGESTDIQEWKNLDQPTIRDNSGKFTRGLTDAAISKIESICWHQMRWLGYTPINDARPQMSNTLAHAEVGLSKIERLLRSRLNQKQLTKGELKRSSYAKSRYRKWR